MVRVRHSGLNSNGSFNANPIPVFCRNVISTRRKIDEYPRSSGEIVWDVYHRLPLLILNVQRDMSEKDMGLLA